MESYTSYLYKDGANCDRRDGLGDDESRKRCWGRPLSTKTPQKNCNVKKDWAPHLHRAQRLIYGNVAFPEPKRTIWVACDYCGCAKKMVEQKKPKPKPVAKVTDYYDRCFSQMADHPRMQKKFEEWLDYIQSPSSDKLEKSRYPEIMSERKEPPKHHCRHSHSPAVCSMPGDQGYHPDVTVIRCEYCPEPYRPWIRNEEADHMFEGRAMKMPFGKDCPDVQPFWEKQKLSIGVRCPPRPTFYQRLTFGSIQDPFELKAKLKLILKGQNID